MTAAVVEEIALVPSVSPGGTLHVRPAVMGDPADGLGGQRARIAEGFVKGSGHGLLALGGADFDVALAPAFAFLRELGRAFVTRLCATPDLEDLRAKVIVAIPADEIERLASAVPPMAGAEYVTADVLTAWWGELEAAFRAEIGEHDGPVEEWLRTLSPSGQWSLVGRVCLHLAENRGERSEERPFAFIATYTTRLSAKSKPQHVPLGRALSQSAERKDRAALLSLLVPVERAAKESPLCAALLESGDLYQALAWTPAEAHAFLKDIPLLERSGVIVRVPDWWHVRRPPRPEVTVRVGGKPPAGARLDAEALLDFDVSVTLDGEVLSAAEIRALLGGAGGLVRLRGRWVEIDRERLRDVLAHWKQVQANAGDGLSFLEGMRLLAGASFRENDGGERADEAGAPIDEVARERVVAGPWLAEQLAGLRTPEAIEASRAAESGSLLKAELRPYQRVGARWLWLATRLGLGVCLADDMGLGKTVQVLALLARVNGARGRGPNDPPHLLVVPASLIGNWQGELARFAPHLRALVAHPSLLAPAELAAAEAGKLDEVDLVITTYSMVARVPWLAKQRWSIVIVDEAQALKNPGAKQTRAVKSLRGQARIALTGTPVENRIGDLWSIFDFLNPGLLGTARELGAFARRLAERPDGYAPLRRLIAPYLLRRLKSDKNVIADLPDKTELKAYCGLAPRQAALYQQSVDELRARLASQEQGIERRGVVLAFLMRFKQICNHPAHWLGNGAWTEGDSGKLGRLREIAEIISAKQEKVLVFTQFREATAPLADFLAGIFGRPGLVLHGETLVKRRTELVRRFQDDDDVPFFVLSVKAGGTGLNLTAASHVVHFDRWWNPAVEDQATDRAYRIGQRRNVLVHKLVCRGTIEEKIDALIEAKQGLARGILAAGGAEVNLTEMSDDELMNMVALDLRRATLDKAPQPTNDKASAKSEAR